MSNSYVNDNDYLTPYLEQIKELVKDIQLLLFVPYASNKSEWDADTQKARVFFNNLGIAVLGVHQIPEERLHSELKDTKAIFIDGGDASQLLEELRFRNLLPTIRTSVLSGEMRYIGSNAGTSIACKTVHTTNTVDGYVYKKEFLGFDIFPFRIELDDTGVNTTSEYVRNAMDSKIADFHQNHREPVVALRTGSYINFDIDFSQTGELCLGGENGVEFFFYNKENVECIESKKILLTVDGIK